MTQENFTIKASKRELVGRSLNTLRNQGFVPAIVYGYGIDPTPVQVNAREFEHTLKRAGRTSLIDLQIDDSQSVKVFIQDVQVHPVKLNILHADFHAVNLEEEIETEVPIVLVGEPAAIRNNIGVLQRGLESLTVRAKPADIPHEIEVNVEDLAEIDQTIYVADIKPSGNYKITSDPEEMVVKIVPVQLEPEEVTEEAEEEEQEQE